MKILGHAPSPVVLRGNANLPINSKVLGWAVNAENDDTFLQSLVDRPTSTVRQFGCGPEGAKLYDSPDDAGAIAVELAYPAQIVAIFNVDDTYMVIPIGGNAASSFGPRSS